MSSSCSSRHRSSLGLCEEPLKPGSMEKVQAYAPILVSCSGSDEGDSSSDQQGTSTEWLLQPRGSVTSTLDGMDSGSCHGSSSGSNEPVPAQMIAEADVQAGLFKTGVRYCLETWPNSRIMRVSLDLHPSYRQQLSFQCF